MDDGHALKIIEKSSRFSTDPCCDCCCGEPGKGGCWGLCFIPTGRVCCRPNHELQLRIYKPHAGIFDKEIMLIDRPFKCAGLCCTCCDCCAQKATLYAAPTCESSAKVDPDQMVAIVQQPLGGGGFVPTLHVKLAEDADPIATIKGGCCCVGGNCCDHTFTVSVPDGDEAKDIGKIVKEAPHDFEDLVQQGMTDADNFTMSYPKDIDPRLKAAMAAALLLIDYQFFEDEGDCYCNPFRCVCGSATGVLQSSRRWLGGYSLRNRRAGTSAASARCADASWSGESVSAGAAATGPAASTAAGAHAAPRLRVRLD